MGAGAVLEAPANVANAGALVASGYSIDSRTVAEGELFFAVKGERLDGHDFVAGALGRERSGRGGVAGARGGVARCGAGCAAADCGGSAHSSAVACRTCAQTLGQTRGCSNGFGRKDDHQRRGLGRRSARA